MGAIPRLCLLPMPEVAKDGWSDWSLLRAGVPELVPPCMSDSPGESQGPPETGHRSREGAGKKYPRLSPAAFSSAVAPPPPSAKHTAARAPGCSLQGSASQGTEQDTTPWYLLWGPGGHFLECRVVRVGSRKGRWAKEGRRGGDKTPGNGHLPTGSGLVDTESHR